MEKLESMSNNNRLLMDDVNDKLREHKEPTDNKINELSNDISDINGCNDDRDDRITRLEAAIETNKQERLRNNIRISGITSTNNLEPAEIALKVFSALKLSFNNNDYHAYSTKGRAFIIVAFHAFSKKMLVISAMRKKKSLLCEEVFPEAVSNGRIFINDHLSDFNANLLNIAWRAKKEGKLFFVSSNGGKIRVKKQEGDADTVFIMSEGQLLSLIDQPTDNSSSNQHIAISETPSTSGIIKQQIRPTHSNNVSKRRQNFNTSSSSGDAIEIEAPIKQKTKRSKDNPHVHQILHEPQPQQTQKTNKNREKGKQRLKDKRNID